MNSLINSPFNVYCLISDGESAEGSVWESLRFLDEIQLTNIKIYANINGWAAYKKVDMEKLSNRLRSFFPLVNIRLTDVNEVIQFETPLAAHYTMANNNMIIK